MNELSRILLKFRILEVKAPCLEFAINFAVAELQAMATKLRNKGCLTTPAPQLLYGLPGQAGLFAQASICIIQC